MIDMIPHHCLSFMKTSTEMMISHAVTCGVQRVSVERGGALAAFRGETLAGLATEERLRTSQATADDDEEVHSKADVINCNGNRAMWLSIK